MATVRFCFVSGKMGNLILHKDLSPTVFCAVPVAVSHIIIIFSRVGGKQASSRRVVCSGNRRLIANKNEGHLAFYLNF